MPPELRNPLLLFINVRKWRSSLFTSGLLHAFTQVNANKICFTGRTLHLINLYPSHSKMLMWRLTLLYHVDIIVATVQQLFKQCLVFNISSQIENVLVTFRIIIFFILNCRKDLSKFNSPPSTSPFSSLGMYQQH